jgi:hypothetical protein
VSNRSRQGKVDEGLTDSRGILQEKSNDRSVSYPPALERGCRELVHRTQAQRVGLVALLESQPSRLEEDRVPHCSKREEFRCELKVAR